MTTRISRLVAAGALVLAAAAGCGPTSTGGAQPPAPAGSAVDPTSDGTPTNAPPADPPPADKPPANPPPAAPPAAAAWPMPEDCVSYRPSSLTAQYATGITTISDGATVVMRIPGGPDEGWGEKGLALAKRYSRHCYVGRDNGREDEHAYVFDYWRTLTGATPEIPGSEDDCGPYDRGNLTVEDMGSGHGWRVKDDDHVLHVFDNEKDARAGKLVLAKYHRICFLGVSDDDDPDLVSYSL